MPYDLDPKDMAAVRAHLGSQLDVLLLTMLDVDAFPIFLFSDDRARLVEARGRAADLLVQWLTAEPDKARGMYSRLPDQLQYRSVAESLLEAVTWADYFDLPIELFRNPAPDSRVLVAAPHLVPLLDESGLVTVTGLDARPWGLHTGEYAFQYHQLLRRSYGSGVHYGLIGTVLRVSNQHGLTARLAIDERRLRFKHEYQEIHEHDHWFGRSLSEEDLDILSVVGETFHGDPDGGTSWLHPYAGVSVRWTADGPLKGVEIEEFMPPPAAGAEWVFARYLHAIRDTDKGAFIHCDGAVKAFAAAAYPQTVKDFRHRGKGDHYRKLFRIDGEFPASVWSELACSWFRGNRLVTEYFGVDPAI
jgi:hypothetical protein